MPFRTDRLMDSKSNFTGAGPKANTSNMGTISPTYLSSFGIYTYDIPKLNKSPTGRIRKYLAGHDRKYPNMSD